MTDPIYYVEVQEGRPLKKLYIADEVANKITIENNIILSSQLTDEFYNSFSFYRVNLSYNVPAGLKGLDDHYLELLQNDIVSINEALDGTYDVVIGVREHTAILNAEWNQIRTQRNQLLQETDWIENSASVSNNTKAKYKAYRSYLRNITDLYDLPNQLVWVDPPDIEYKIEKDTKIYTPDQLEKIKNYVPGSKNKDDWNSFLTAWKNTNFIDSILGVNSLIHMNLTITASGTTFNINEIIQ